VLAQRIRDITAQWQALFLADYNARRGSFVQSVCVWCLCVVSVVWCACPPSLGYALNILGRERKTTSNCHARHPTHHTPYMGTHAQNGRGSSTKWFHGQLLQDSWVVTILGGYLACRTLLRVASRSLLRIS